MRLFVEFETVPSVEKGDSICQTYLIIGWLLPSEKMVNKERKNILLNIQHVYDFLFYNATNISYIPYWILVYVISFDVHRYG